MCKGLGMGRSRKHDKPGKSGAPAGEGRPSPSRLDPLWRALEWPGATGWVGTALAVAALWFGVSALVLRSKRSRMETGSQDARTAAEESRTWGFGDRFLTPVLLPNGAGVVVRESAEPGARFVAVVLGDDGRASVLTRLAPGQPAARMPLQPAPGRRPPEWVSLSRRGDVIEASVSPDGATWSTGGLRRKLSLPGGAIVGPAVFPATGEPCAATFRSVRLEPGAGAEWGDAGEGEAAKPPASVVSGSTATVASGGAASKATGGSSHFAFTTVKADFGIVARVGRIDPAFVLPEALTGRELARARAAVAADARSSGVFGFFLAVLAALVWGIRRFDPSVRAEAARRSGERRE